MATDLESSINDRYLGMLVLVGSSKNAICYLLDTLLQSDMTDFSVELGQPTAGGRARATHSSAWGGIMAICLSSHSFIRNHFLAASLLGRVQYTCCLQ